MVECSVKTSLKNTFCIVYLLNCLILSLIYITIFAIYNTSECSGGIEDFSFLFIFFMCLDDCDRLDRQTQATTFIHQVFGGYLRSRGKFLVIYLLYISLY